MRKSVKTLDKHRVSMGPTAEHQKNEVIKDLMTSETVKEFLACASHGQRTYFRRTIQELLEAGYDAGVAVTQERLKSLMRML
jgi:hypothetical protein